MSSAGLPTTDELLGEKPANDGGQLPTTDELLQPKHSAWGSLGQIAKTPLDLGAAAWADATRSDDHGLKSTPALDAFFGQTPAGHILHAFGQNVKDAWGTEKLGISDQTAEDLRKAGVFNDYRDGKALSARVLIEGTLRPAAVAADAAQRGIIAAAHGVGGALQQTAKEIQGEHPTALSTALATPFGGAGEVVGAIPEGFIPEVPMRAPLAPQIARARSLGVIGEGEEGFMGTKEPAPATAADRMEAVRQHNDHVAATEKEAGVPEAPETAPPPGSEQPVGAEPPAPVETPAPQPPDIHQIAREIDPAAFQQYDALIQRQNTYRQWLSELGEKRTEAPEVKEAQGRIDDILAKVGGNKDRLTKAQAQRLEDARDQLETAQRTDTPDMAFVRKNLLDVQHRLWDVAPSVRAAMKQAQERMPPEAEAPTPVAVPNVTLYRGEPAANSLEEGISYDSRERGRWFTHSLDAAKAYAGENGNIFKVDVPADKLEGASEKYRLESNGEERLLTPEIAGRKTLVSEPSAPATEAPRTAPSPIGKLKASLQPEIQGRQIASDVSKKLVNAGRPKEEADAAAALVASHYEARAARFKGALGNAYELYAKEGPSIKTGGRAPVKEFAQGEGTLEQGANEDKSNVSRIDQHLEQNAGLFGQKAADAYHRLEAELHNKYGDGIYQKAPRLELERLKDLDRRSIMKEPAKALPEITGLDHKFYQGKRGSITLKGARNTIRLFKDADASTFIHETGHQWLEEMMKDARDERAPADLLTDAKTVRDWMGVKEGEAIPTKAHEKFARGFERYMMEGTAPTKALAGVFAKFKAWLTQIYQTVSRLKSPINGDIRGVFDRLVATPDHEPIIASERPLEKNMADLHEEDAESTPAAKATPVADKIRTEIDKTAEKVAPDVHAELPHKGEAETGRVPGENAGAAGGANEAGPAAGNGGGPAEPGEVPAGGNEAAPEGPDLGAAAGEGRGSARGGATDTPAGSNERFTDPESHLVDKAGNIRLENLGTPEDVNQVIRETAQDTGGFLDARRGVLSDAQVLDLADALGMNPAFLNARKIGQAFNAEQIIAARKLLIKSATEVRDKMRAVSDGGDDNAVMAYAEARARHVMIQEQVSGITAEAGRALRAFRKMEGGDEAKLVGDFLKDATGRTLNQLREEARLGASLQTPSQVSKYMDDLAKTPLKNAIIEYYVNALISGPITHFRYSVGNALNALWTPLVQIPIAATIGAAREAVGIGADANRVHLGEAGAQIFAMVKGSRDGWKAATEAFQTGMSPSLPGERYHMQMLGAIPGVVGKAIRIPGKSVSAIHSFFKSLRYEQNIQGLAYRTAMNEGLAGDAFTNRVSDLTMRPTPEMIDEAGYLKQDAMDKAHFENVESATQNALKELYMSPTKYDSAMGALNRAVDRSLVAKIIIPFMKIGSQITRNAFVEQTPLGLFSKDIQGEFAAGGARADFQAAKMTAGIALGGITVGLAAEGLATGDGPEDPRLRAVWLLNHRPNSITIGPLTFPYQGLGSLGMLMRFSANTYEVGHQIGHEDTGKLAVAFLEGATKSVLDENFMRGVKDMLDAVYHPEEYGESYIKGFVTNWLPYSVGLSQVARKVDPYLRLTSKEPGTAGFAQSIWDTAKQKIPFVSTTLPPRRDMFGEPIPSDGPLPQYETDPVVREMDKLQIGIGTLQRKIRGIPLTDSQYDDYSRIAGRYTKILMDQDVAMEGWSEFPAELRIKMLRASTEQARRTAADSVMLDDLTTAAPGQSIMDRAINSKTQGLMAQ